MSEYWDETSDVYVAVHKKHPILADIFSGRLDFFAVEELKKQAKARGVDIEEVYKEVSESKRG